MLQRSLSINFLKWPKDSLVVQLSVVCTKYELKVLAAKGSEVCYYFAELT